jgi:hypothetical protein
MSKFCRQRFVCHVVFEVLTPNIIDIRSTSHALSISVNALMAQN